jgi:hypothetical protein
MPLTVRRHIRKMRGGAQSHLMEADDGHFYIVKFQNNPQHRRVLVNELIGSVFLKYLQISTPETALIQLSDEFLRNTDEISIQLGTQKIAVKSGWHFGSRHPGDPAQMAVYDFIPDTLLYQVNNLSDFLGVLVLDKWACNTDGRQAVFFRARIRDWLPSGGGKVHPMKLGFVAIMVDQGFEFNGPHWDFPESPVQGLYSRKLVYENVKSLSDFEPWLDQVIHFPEDVVDQAFKQIPPEWIDGEEEELERMLEKLLRRRKRLPDLLSDSRRAKVNPFPNWR